MNIYMCCTYTAEYHYYNIVSLDQWVYKKLYVNVVIYLL